MNEKVRIWRKSEFQDNERKNVVTDPQTHGERWKVWPVTGSDEASVLYCQMRRDEQTGLHSHPSHHYGVVIEGSGIVWTDGEMAAQHQGDIIHIPPNVPHSFGGSATEDCWMVDFVRPHMTLDDITFYPDRDAEVAEAFQKWKRQHRR